ncbi:hypothetical protein [Dactylosporangium sp. NPDC005555]|uniref:hypothetical protein n=1 Tax=Dactylosporangium sp. NPDC005555 TaxID=3154889 RepID=UPI0033BDAE66
MIRVRWWRWTVMTTAGELAGFTVPAAAGATSATLAWPAGASYAALLAAGFVEGAVLGYSQATVLRRALPALRVRRFWAATGAALTGLAATRIVPEGPSGRDHRPCRPSRAQTIVDASHF